MNVIKKMLSWFIVNLTFWCKPNEAKVSMREFPVVRTRSTRAKVGDVVLPGFIRSVSSIGRITNSEGMSNKVSYGRVASSTYCTVLMVYDKDYLLIINEDGNVADLSYPYLKLGSVFLYPIVSVDCNQERVAEDKFRLNKKLELNRRLLKVAQNELTKQQTGESK